jgi:adenylyltransferase/sulfurtransferase
VFFREGDEGRQKAPVVASAAAELNSAVEIAALHADVRLLPLGFMADFDLVLGGLDNREARLWINGACRKLGIPWIDGAIEGLRGVVRTFLPDGPCYECTLGEADRALLARRQSCALLSADDIADGKTPTTATSSSIVAAVQTQEAVKLLTGRRDLLALSGQGWNFIGDTLETWLVDYPEDEFCLAHDRYGPLLPTPCASSEGLGDLLARLHAPVLASVGGLEAVDLEYDLVLAAECPACGAHRTLGRRLAALSRGDGECRACGAVAQLDARTSLSQTADAQLFSGPLAALDLGDRDVITLRGPAGRAHLDLRMSP